MSERARIVVLVSGNGSNLQAILDACGGGQLPAAVVAVVSDKANAFGLQRARDAAIAAEVQPFGPFRRAHTQPRLAYDAALAARVAAHRPDLVVLAGFMRILSPTFIDAFAGRLINLHPALPGALPGIHAIARALAAYKTGDITTTGVMVHHVIAEVDAGAPIAVAEVAISADDDLATLSARIHAVEHQLLVDAIAVLLPTLSQSSRPHSGLVPTPTARQAALHSRSTESS